MSTSIPGKGWATPAVFQLGKGKTLSIPMEMHQLARNKLVNMMHSRNITSGVILIKGGEDTCRYDSDTDVLFRQDSWFNYLFGVKEAGLIGAIRIDTKQATLFIPKLPDDYRIISGTIHPPEHFQLSYGVDEALYLDDIPTWIKSALDLQSTSSMIYLLKGLNTDSGSFSQPLPFSGDDVYYKENRINLTDLHFCLSTSRVTKCPMEVEVMRYCAWVASNAHVEVMRHVKNCTFEYELEAKFLYEIYRNGGCRHSAYNSICGCGPNGSVLHYGHAGAPNDRAILPTDMALLDMGADYHGYMSDITCSFPVSGKFTADQKAIFEGVLAAQTAVLAHMKPGNLWSDCHVLAETAIIKALQGVGILHPNYPVEELIAKRIGAVFFPHGLGHLIGCDTHDVGGYLDGTPERILLPGLKKLRTARVLEEGMILTNEPGCYFIDFLLDAATTNPETAHYINVEVLKRFRGFGGVRLEDVVMVTKTGVENLTTCPRTVGEVESVLNGGSWPPEKDTAPYLFRKWTKLNPDCSGMLDVKLDL